MASMGLSRRAVLTGLALPAIFPSLARARTPPALQQELAVSRPTYQAEALASVLLVNSTGQRMQLADLRAPLVLVNLWAHWCVNCLNELPTIRNLQANVGSANLDVVMLSDERFWKADVAYAHRVGLTFALWRLAPETPEALAAASFGMENGQFSLPQTLLFAGRRKRLMRHEVGARDWGSAGSISRARTWLAAAR